MMSGANELFWEEKYKAGHAQRYPWDFVVTFVLRNAPKGIARSQIRILEVGCGTASNLWFAAREGFSVVGLDASASGIEEARRRFAADGLTGEFLVGDFSLLPLPEGSFDLAIDRGAITCVAPSVAGRAVAEIHRTLKVGGRFLFNPYSLAHSSAQSGRISEEGVVSEISAGSLVDSGDVFFYSRRDIYSVLGPGWSTLKLDHVVTSDEAKPERLVHAEWRAIVCKTARP